MQYQGKLMMQHQSLDIMVSYHAVQYQKKTNDPILRTDGPIEGETEQKESDFRRLCPTEVKHPIFSIVL